ncbi:hypothetical protein BDR26DRAFT_866223 [Obelidium mucronatum]|nr:hypothetical protein BDR26DRAFT_866223 [Obelidium mucronatum]
MFISRPLGACISTRSSGDGIRSLALGRSLETRAFRRGRPLWWWWWWWWLWWLFSARASRSRRQRPLGIAAIASGASPGGGSGGGGAGSTRYGDTTASIDAGRLNMRGSGGAGALLLLLGGSIRAVVVAAVVVVVVVLAWRWVSPAVIGCD